MQSDSQNLGTEAEGRSKPITSIQAYRTIVLALALLILGIAVWPKQSPHAAAIATIEIALNPPGSNVQTCSELLDEARETVFSHERMLETVDLAWNQWLHDRPSDQPLDREGWAHWLEGALQIQTSERSLDDYVHITLSVEGTADPFVPHLINQAALALSTYMDRQLTRDDIYHRWSIEQNQLEQALSERRNWLERLERTLERQSTGLRVITASDTSAPREASFVSTERPPTTSAPLPIELDLLMAEIQMKTEDLVRLSNERLWQTGHPERIARLQEIDQMKRTAVLQLNAIGRSPADYPMLASAIDATNSSGSATIHRNEFYSGNVQSDAQSQQTTLAIADLDSANQELESLKSTAASLLLDEERLLLHWTSWLDGNASPTHARVLELATAVPPNGTVIPSSHWLLLGLMSSVLAMAFGWNLSRQPDRFFTADHVSDSLGLPVLGVVMGEGQAPQGFWTTLKRHERRIQWSCEILLMGALGIVLLGLLMDPRLFEVLVDHPLDGLARSMQLVFG